MTTILRQQCYRNASGNATIYVEKYMEKGSIPLWRVTYKIVGYDVGRIYRDRLLRKPSKRQIRGYIENI